VPFIEDKCELEEHRRNYNFTEKWTFTRKYEARIKGRIRHSARPEWILCTVYI